MLKNTLYKLQKEKKLNVGYYGGSITEGAGSSDINKTCWRALTTTWLREQYPDCEINEIQAAIGGTGTDLGVFRCEQDLLSKKPDLIFMEYTVNDDGTEDIFEVVANSEGIVRKIFRANPYAEILYVHTSIKPASDKLAQGIEYNSRTAHSIVMHYYGITQIDAGEVLRHKVLTGDGDWLKVTHEGIHPRDNGYAVYADAVISCLKYNLEGQSDELVPVTLPDCLLKDNREYAYMASAQDAISETGDTRGWRRVNQSMYGRYESYIEADVPGSEFEYHFTGRRIGFYLLRTKDAGDLYYRIDGGEEQQLRTWDEFCLEFNRAHGIVLPEKLQEGPHTITIRVGETKAEQSTGTAIRIGAFLIY